MFELVTLILVLYVAHSIARRSAERKRELDRIQTKVRDLQQMVQELRGLPDDRGTVPERLVAMELQELCSHLRDEFDSSADEMAQQAFAHEHFVEEHMSKSILMAPMPTNAESTL